MLLKYRGVLHDDAPLHLPQRWNIPRYQPAQHVLPPCAVSQEVLRGSRDRIAENLNLDVTQRGFEGHGHRLTSGVCVGEGTV